MFDFASLAADQWPLLVAATGIAAALALSTYAGLRSPAPKTL